MHVVPYFTYCSNVWFDGDNRTNIERIYKMQKYLWNKNQLNNVFKSWKWIPIEFTVRKREILMTFMAILRTATEYI